MRVGLVDVDSKIPNLALMKLSAWHKAQGDSVKFYDPLFDRPDVVYASKIFRFTPEYPYLPTDIQVTCGGSRMPPAHRIVAQAVVVRGGDRDVRLYRRDHERIS